MRVVGLLGKVTQWDQNVDPRVCLKVASPSFLQVPVVDPKMEPCSLQKSRFCQVRIGCAV